MYSDSLDPRVRRMSDLADYGQQYKSEQSEQEHIFEVFVQSNAKKPYEHVGNVHGSFLEAAFLYAKEQYSRRGGICNGLAVVDQADIFCSSFAEPKQSGWKQDFPMQVAAHLSVISEEPRSFHIFAIAKRGRYGKHVGPVLANSLQNAYILGGEQFANTECVAFWVIEETKMMWSDEAQKDIWNTLIEKKYRDALAYKAGDKIEKIRNR